MTSNTTVTELRNVHLGVNEKDELDSDIKNNQNSCLDNCLLWLINTCPIDPMKSCISTSLTTSYDLLTILISIADVTTDVWVIYNYKIQNRQVFFDLSLAVMILAQLSYAIAFVMRFENDMCEKPCKHIALFCVILPMTPFMSFIFYWLSFDNNILINTIKHFGFRDEFSSANNIHKKQAPIIIWIKKKMLKHMGFIMEAVFEALPQSIIQLIAIVYYQDTEIINIVSICISLLSVATKTMVFSVAIDYRVFFFNWLSLVCDFFGIFAIVSWYDLLLFLCFGKILVLVSLFWLFLYFLRWTGHEKITTVVWQSHFDMVRCKKKN